MKTEGPPLAIPSLYHAPGAERTADAWAERFALPRGGGAESPAECPGELILWQDAEGLALRQTGKRAMGPLRCEFAVGSARHRRLYGGGKSQAVARAVGVGRGIRPLVADLTAGLGADAFALAGLGCRVIMVERHPAIAALLADGLTRAEAEDDPGLAETLGRLSLVHVDARDWLADNSERPDVIYLDPMFPERGKSAAVNKAMQFFQRLVGSDEDAADLLAPALAVARNRVVIKRPARAPWLAGSEPSYSLTGKSVRFDIHALRRMTA